jgi:DNA-binding transcriptional LysR family regulator
MNWEAVTFDWNRLRAFLATVEEGTLSQAARVLHTTQPTLGRQIAALEQDLDLVLFERVGKKLVLTPTGAELAEHARAMRDAAARVSLVASGQSKALEGQVRLSAADGFSTYVLPPIIADIRAKAPGLQIELVVSNAVSDLQRRDADIAIRHVRPEQPDLIARLVRTGGASFYATRRYLENKGHDPAALDLKGLDIIGFAPRTRFVQELAQRGFQVAPSQVAVETENGVAATQLMLQGVGAAILFDDITQLFPDLVRLLPDHDPIPVPIWLVAHRELLTSRRIRLVYDHLCMALSHSDIAR